MNAIRQEITGKVVVLEAAVLKDGVDPRFLCEGGFGCYPFTMGTKIHGRFISDGEEATVSGEWVAAVAEDQSVRPPAPATA